MARRSEAAIERKRERLARQFNAPFGEWRSIAVNRDATNAGLGPRGPGVGPSALADKALETLRVQAVQAVQGQTPTRSGIYKNTGDDAGIYNVPPTRENSLDPLDPLDPIRNSRVYEKAELGPRAAFLGPLGPASALIRRIIEAGGTSTIGCGRPLSLTARFPAGATIPDELRSTIAAAGWHIERSLP